MNRWSNVKGWAPPVLARVALMIAGCSLVAAGCGYQPYGRGELPPEIQSLHLSALTNGTFKPDLQGLVSAAILRRLQQDGRIRTAPAESATLILGGTLTGYQNLPIAFDQNDIGLRFLVRITLAMQLTERDGEKVLLKEEIFGEAFYTTGSDVVGTRSAEDEARRRAAQDLATRVVVRLMEGL